MKNIKNLKHQKFNKWENKNFSIFKSIGKTINIGVLLISYLIITNYNLSAQSDTIKIKEIKIKTMQIPFSYSETSRIINIIDNSQIKNAPVNNVQDLLEYAASIDVRQRGNNGVQSDLSIRGGSFDQNLILLNGIKINDPQTGHNNLNLPINLDNIDRIEILEGAGAKEYGPNAFSGAINIITKQNEPNKISTNLSIGENNFLEGQINISFNTKRTNQNLSIGKNNSKGYINNTDFNISNYFYQINYKNNSTRINFQAGYIDKAFGANSFYTPKYPNQFEHTRTLISGLKITSGKKIKFTNTLYTRTNQDKFELFRSDPPIWYKNHNYHLTNVIGLTSKLGFNSSIGKTTIGIDADIENIYSNLLGDNLPDTLKAPFEENGYYTKFKSVNNINLFINNTKEYKYIYVSAGLLVNINSSFGTNFSPGINFAYNFSNNLKAIAGYNWSIRMPTFTDLYYIGPTNIGNKDLKPEKSRTHEIGLIYNKKIISTSFSVFHRNGIDIIDWVKSTDTSLWESKNITSLKTYGIEFLTSLNLSKIYNNSFITDITLKYNFITTTKNSQEYISLYALDYLKQKINLNINHKIYKNLSASWFINYQDRNGTYTDFKLGKEASFKPITLLDAQINYSKSFYNIYLKVTNFTNVVYFDISNITMPKRWIYLGLKLNFNY